MIKAICRLREYQRERNKIEAATRGTIAASKTYSKYVPQGVEQKYDVEGET